MKFFKFAIAMPILVGISFGGCATVRPLHTETSTAAIRSAEELGAQEVPQASLHLQLAKENVAAAEALNKDGKDDEGRSLLLRAEADAELAIALSRVETERAEAQDAMDRVRKLQSENPATSGGAQ